MSAPVSRGDQVLARAARDIAELLQKGQHFVDLDDGRLGFVFILAFR
ncbi:hypothetical protein ACIOD0_00540 [Kitasatospora albolonga]